MSGYGVHVTQKTVQSRLKTGKESPHNDSLGVFCLPSMGVITADAFIREDMTGLTSLFKRPIKKTIINRKKFQEDSQKSQ